MDKKDYYYNPKEFRRNTGNNIWPKYPRPYGKLTLILMGWILGVMTSIVILVKEPSIAVQLLDLFG